MEECVGCPRRALPAVLLPDGAIPPLLLLHRPSSPPATLLLTGGYTSLSCTSAGGQGEGVVHTQCGGTGGGCCSYLLFTPNKVPTLPSHYACRPCVIPVV